MEALGRLYDISAGIVPVDMNTNNGESGLRVHLKNYSSIDFVVFKAAGTAAEDPTYDVQQHTAASSGTTADLDVVTRYHHKSEATLDGDETWALVTQSAASEVVDPGGAGTSAELQSITVIHVDAAQLSDGFEWVSLVYSATASNAQLACVLYILNEPAVQRAPANLAQPQL